MQTREGPRQYGYPVGGYIGGFNPADFTVDAIKGGAFWTTTQTVSPSTSMMASTASAGS